MRVCLYTQYKHIVYVFIAQRDAFKTFVTRAIYGPINRLGNGDECVR